MSYSLGQARDRLLKSSLTAIFYDEEPREQYGGRLLRLEPLVRSKLVCQPRLDDYALNVEIEAKPTKAEVSALVERRREAAAPPTCDHFDSLCQMTPEEPINSSIEICRNPTNCKCFRSWVTVFGYPKECEPMVLSFFSHVGALVDNVFNEDANWMFLCYKNMSACNAAVKYNHSRILPYGFNVGVYHGAPPEVNAWPSQQCAPMIAENPSDESISEEVEELPNDAHPSFWHNLLEKCGW